MIFNIRAWGPRACWTPIGQRLERYSEFVPRHAAVRGLLRGVLGKREHTWVIHEVHLLKRPRHERELHNELKFDSKPSKPTDPPYFIEGHRTQRSIVYLHDVDYLIKASIRLNASAGPEDNLAKFENMFRYRMEKGQLRRHIYFGTKECVANLELVEDTSVLPAPVDLSEDMGITYFDTDWEDPKEPAYFAPLEIVHGVVTYPTWSEVKLRGFCRTTTQRAG